MRASTFIRTAYNELLINRNHNLDFHLSSILTRACNIGYPCTVSRSLHVSVPRNVSHFKPRDRKELLKTVKKVDDGTIGEHNVLLDARIKSRENMFPDENTPSRIFNGIPFSHIPVCSIKVTKNNTIIRLCDHENKCIVFRSCGMEGFKNCRKGTNVAGQSTALFVSTKAVSLGIKDIRLKIQGLGPGRMAAIKGLQMGGLNVISVTDDTRVSFRPTCRPRKVRRL